MGVSVAQIERVYRSRYVGFRTALTLTVGDAATAHDILQDAFAEALSHRRTIRRPEALEAWIWRTAVRLAWRHGRPRGDALQDPDDPEPFELDRYGDLDLRRAISQLSPRRQQILFLRYFVEMSYEQIADTVDVAPGTVAATIAQTHRKLQASLREGELA